MSKKAIYEVITEYLDSLNIPDGEIVSLGKDFRLPKEATDGMKFADGAWDGISIYHMGSLKITDEDIAEIGNAVILAASGDYSKADTAFEKVCNRIKTVNYIDELQRFIVERSRELDASTG